MLDMGILHINNAYQSIQLTCIWVVEGIFKKESLGNKMSLPAENK